MEADRNQVLGNTNTIMVDDESLVPGSTEGTANMRYRSVSSGQAANSATIEYVAVANCMDMTITHSRSIVMQEGRSFPVDIATSGFAGQAIVADISHGVGKAVLRACEKVQPNLVSRFRTYPSAEECKVPADSYIHVLCTSDPVRLRIGLLRHRTQRVASTCGEQSLYESEMEKRTAKAARCLGLDQCVRRALGDMAAAINDDFGRILNAASSGQSAVAPCKSAERLRAIAESERKIKQAEEDLRAAELSLQKCADIAAIRLDDRVSDARTIAGAAVGSCREHANRLASTALMTEPSRDDRSIKSRIEDEVARKVLEHRAKSRKR